MTFITSILLIGLPNDRDPHPGRYVVHVIVKREVVRYNCYTNKPVQEY
jgi:hypothetical protein